MVSQTALAEHVEHLQLALEGAGMGTFDHDLESSEVQVSPLTCRIYGLPVSPTLRVEQMLAGVDAQGREGRRRAFDAARDPNGTGVYEAEYRIGRPPDARWICVRGRVVFGVDGAGARGARRVVGMITDITTQKTQQQTLEQFTAMMAAVGNSTDAFMYVKDRNGRMVFCNAAVLRALGKPAGEVLGKTDVDFSGPGPATEAIMAHDRQVMAEGTPQVYHETIQGLDRVYFSTKTPYRDVRGEVIGLAGVSVDVTELHQARQALQESEERASLAAEAAEIGIFEFDPANDRLTWSSTLREQFGTDMAEVVTLQSALQRIHPDDREGVRAAVAKALEPTGDGRYNIEYRTVPVAGEVRWLHLLGRVHFREEAGRRVAERFAGVSINITKRRALEQQLRDADRRKDEFLAMLAHELRNPLAPLLNATATLQRGDARPEQIARIADIANRQTRHMARLIDDLLDASRLTLGKISIRKAPLGLGELVASAAEHAIQSDVHERVLDVRIAPDPMWVDGDPVRLMQLVSNLLNNAVKFTTTGGTIRIELRREGAQAVLVVQDDGQGIRADLLPHVFKLFTQGESGLDRASGGLGIGLSLVRALAELHGGSVQAHSDGPGQGARFTVRLPLASPPAATAGADAPQAASATRRILIIEDNLDAAETLKMMLELQGHEVATAASGPAGLEAARQATHDTMLIDIGLPGMSGFEVARRLREQAVATPRRLIALTGYGSPDDKQRVLEAGFDLHLVKPVTLEELARALQ